MAEQLQLIETRPSPKLTGRQQAVLDALTQAAHDGITTDEAGATAHALKEGRWAHGPDDRCLYCSRDGRQILEALRTKGLARYRSRLKVWQLADLPAEKPEPARAWDGTGPVPYGVIPY